jgi:hypothetical protein
MSGWGGHHAFTLQDNALEAEQGGRERFVDETKKNVWYRAVHMHGDTRLSDGEIEARYNEKVNTPNKLRGP